jgi:hypothetical protein
VGGVTLKQKLTGLVIGLFIGAAAMVAVPAFGAAKQYVLTLFERPVVVNGQAYTDASQPILNYNGRTYVPLAKVGELTGVPVKWNEQLKRVEIGGKPATYEEVIVSERDLNPGSGGSSATDGPAGRKNDNLKPDTEIIREEKPGYKGYPDSSDITYQMAVVEKWGDLPPLMSEGWISEGMLDEIESVYFGGSGEKGKLIFSNKNFLNQKIYKTITVTDEFIKAQNGDYEFDDIRIKVFRGNLYFNIADLKNAGIIS